MTASDLAEVALAYWRSQGERTRERLENLVELYEERYAYCAIDIDAAKRLAWERVKSWELF